MKRPAEIGWHLHVAQANSHDRACTARALPRPERSEAAPLPDENSLNFMFS